MSCCCGHDHEHEHHHEDAALCVCGQPMTEGVGHGRSMGRTSFAVAGGFLILNSFILEWIFPRQEFASEISAMLGAVILLGKNDTVKMGEAEKMLAKVAALFLGTQME